MTELEEWLKLVNCLRGFKNGGYSGIDMWWEEKNT